MKAMAGNLVAAHSTYQSTSVGVKRLSGSAAGFFASLKVSVQRNRQVHFLRTWLQKKHDIDDMSKFSSSVAGLWHGEAVHLCRSRSGVFGRCEGSLLGRHCDKPG